MLSRGPGLDTRLIQKVPSLILLLHAGLADPNALSQAVSAFQACQFIGMPGCEVHFSTIELYMHVYLTQSLKSNNA